MPEEGPSPPSFGHSRVRNVRSALEKNQQGQNFRMFYMPQDREAGLPELLLAQATKEGRARHIGRRVRRNGTTFWGSILITALHDDEGNVMGFTKLTKELGDNEID
ncbi:MAG: PAS domain S-box protein [Chitinophagaceae bacterium]|nr:MAG: PAS domain S-box protein [Chitinophagaceae bacterium]